MGRLLGLSPSWIRELYGFQEIFLLAHPSLGREKLQYTPLSANIYLLNLLGIFADVCKIAKFYRKAVKNKLWRPQEFIYIFCDVFRLLWNWFKLMCKNYNFTRPALLPCQGKELSLCNKLKFSNPYILATWWTKSLIFKTQIFLYNRIQSLKYLRSTTLCAHSFVQYWDTIQVVSCNTGIQYK